MKAELIEYQSIELATNAMGKCYGVKCSIKTLINACKVGHTSLLEHVNATFELEVSEKLLAQITRHRHFSYTVESSRGSDITQNDYFDKFERPTDVDKADWDSFIGFMKNQVGIVKKMYKTYTDKHIPKEYASYLIPMAQNVHITMTGNLRAWIEYLKARLCKRASFEHQLLAREIFKELNCVYPSVITLDMIGICKNCQEASCDFTKHKKEEKKPIVSQLINLEKGKNKIE